MAEQTVTSRRDIKITVLLGALTIIATLTAAIPSFLSLRAKRSLVIFEMATSEIAYPPNADRNRIKEILDKERIPDSTVTASLQNVGDQPAAVVELSITVPGEILSYKSFPEPREKPPWVTIHPSFDVSSNPGVISYELNKLAVGPKFKVEVSYRKTASGDAKCEIFSDGFPAVPSDTPLDKRASKHGTIARPVAVLVIGTLITFGVYTFYRVRRRPELKSSFETVLATLFPFRAIFSLPRQLAANNEYKRYRNEVLRAILRNKNVEFLSIAEGSIDAINPELFWDIRLKMNGAAVGIDVHTQSQNWFNDKHDPVEFCAHVSQMAKANGGKGFLVFDAAFSSADQSQELAAIITDLNRASPGCEIALLIGDAANVASEIYAATSGVRSGVGC